MAARSRSPHPPGDDKGRRTARQAEQRRIAQILHDSVAQGLTAVYLQAVVLAQKMDRDGIRSAAEVAHLANMLHDVVVELREVTRLLSSEAEPPPNPVSPPAGAAGVRQAS